MRFAWDAAKERLNIAKHGLDFATAAQVFADMNRVEFYDEAHSLDEDRYITIGMIDGVALIVQVVYTERGEKIRLISARKATKREERVYYGSLQGH